MATRFAPVTSSNAAVEIERRLDAAAATSNSETPAAVDVTEPDDPSEELDLECDAILNRVHRAYSAVCRAMFKIFDCIASPCFMLKMVAF